MLKNFTFLYLRYWLHQNWERIISHVGKYPRSMGIFVQSLKVNFVQIMMSHLNYF